MSKVGFTTNQYKSRTKKGLFFFPYGFFFLQGDLQSQSKYDRMYLYTYIYYIHILYMSQGRSTPWSLGMGDLPPLMMGIRNPYFPSPIWKCHGS